MPDNPKLSAIALLILRASLRSEAERGEGRVTSGLTDSAAAPAAGSGSGDEAGTGSGVIGCSFDEAGGGVSVVSVSGTCSASTSSSRFASGPLVPRGDFVFSEVDMRH